MSENPPVGWYPNPDPNKPGTSRFWDGAAWTDYLHTDFTGVDSQRLSKLAARQKVVELIQTVHQLEDIVNRHGLRPFEDFTQWRQERIDALDGYHTEVTADAQRLIAEKARAEEDLKSLREEIVLATDIRDLQDLGYFDYEHPAQHSTQLATELAGVTNSIKMALKYKEAATTVSGFTFNNSAAQGRRFVESLTKLLLRAYNAEAENALKSTRAGNLHVAQNRLNRAAEQIAKNGAMIELRITESYHQLRLKELELAARHLQALAYEKDLERERKAELREQRKAELELKREQERLEKERSHYETALAVLRENGDDEAVARMLEKIADVERAISDVDYRAANIRAGYVYVISNEGAFGPGVVKIGMTRRLEPMDRVRELGDASVPFRFDVHALFFAHDAVAIESMLHQEFAASRLNQVNLRREFFDATPQQVLDVLRAHNVELLEFRLDVEAEEFRKSTEIRELRLAEM